MCNLDKYYTKENTSGLWPRQGRQYLAFAVKAKAEVNQGIREKRAGRTVCGKAYYTKKLGESERWKGRLRCLYVGSEDKQGT